MKPKASPIRAALAGPPGGLLPALLACLLSTGAQAATPHDGSVLPFAPTPSASIAEPRLQDSKHVRRVENDHLPKRRTQHSHCPA